MRVKVDMDIQGDGCDELWMIRDLLEEDWGLATAQKVHSIEEIKEDNMTLLEVTKTEQAFKDCRKKPVVVQAAQINEPFIVETLEGPLRGKSGDYLIVGVRGERYPIDKDIFEETYDWV